MHFGVRSLALSLAVPALALAAQAQITLPFTLNQPASAFTFSGSTTLGGISGNPSNTFQLLGSQNMDVTFQAGAQPFATGAFSSGGSVGTNGSLHGKATRGFGITIATIDVNNLTMSATSPSFAVGAGGAFTASVTLTALTGQLVVTPVGGSASTSDIGGSVSSPFNVNGTLTIVSGALHLVAPVNATFPFTDPSSGISGSLTLVGTITADYAMTKPYCYGDGTGTACPCTAGTSGNGCPNASFASGAHLAASGLSSLTADSYVLSSTLSIPGGPGLFFQGSAQTVNGSVFGNGLLCLTGSTPRLEIRFADGSGAASSTVAIHTVGAVASSGLKYYQMWYRDGAAYCTGAGFNLTNALSTLWIP